MDTKNKNTANAGNPFETLAIEINKDPEPVTLQVKEEQQFDVKRTSKREVYNGNAIIYNMDEIILAKAEFKNVSPGGVSLEILPFEINPNQEVYIHFSSALNLGKVLCSIQWITDIEGHKENHRLIGLKFKKLTKIKLKMLQEFMAKIQTDKAFDLNYVG